ncbi:hypothetical protein MIND_01053000 [Mycena indigotica]|uniref:Uncharacterized protein n=1 Tax=Mycena indigotica TaxID=2126181 RepID=A0A8H6S8V5_9AGAR|nr:uncharacterized protein MIND_01053000 [Mycena indigotica]KAF7295145.1 hypothetical protein MIND_01053000 [Mycena indigotica]
MSEVEEGSLQALFNSFAMIIASEIGDKTFLIAAILAMRHPRLIVFAGAFGSLVVMSILSAEMGHILPTLIPKKWTQAAAAALFLVFGGKMLMEGRAMKSGNDKIQEEMREAQEEIEGDESPNNAIPLEHIEAGLAATTRISPSQPRSLAQGARNFFNLFFGPVFVQAFILTFLGEWGDRSQIATIALGAAHNVYLVTAGTIFGHSCCTALAVIGGRYVSSKISVKHVTLGGAFLFLLFGLIYLYEAFGRERGPDIEMTIASYNFPFLLMTTENIRDGPGHLLSLKVMRVSRPSLASAWQPFYSSSPSFSTHSTTSILSLQATDPLPGHPKTLRDLHVSELLTLPSSFGKIELGETFSSCLCVNNEAQSHVEAVHLKVEMQTVTSKVSLGEFGGADTRLAVGDALEDAVVHHEVKELGQHVLACTVSYRLPSTSSPNDTEQIIQTFRKFYKFAVTNPLSVKTKVHTPRSPSALLSRAEREKLFLEIHIQNLTTDSLWFERIQFESAGNWDAFDANEGIFAGSMQPQDMRQYIYVLSRPINTLQTQADEPGSVIPLGRLDIYWRSAYGEPGRLLTSMLSRKIPPVVQPAPALPLHLKRGVTGPHSPQLSMSRPDSPISSQRPASPFRNRPPSSIIPRTLTPPPAPSISDIQVNLVVRHLATDNIRLNVPFKIELTMSVSAHVSLGRRRSLLIALQHLEPLTSSPAPAIPRPPASESFSPRIASSPGFSTPSPMSATFNVQLAHQKLSGISSAALISSRSADVIEADTYTLPPPYFSSSDPLKPRTIFCGSSAIQLEPIELIGDQDDDMIDVVRELELQYMPVSVGFSSVGGLRAVLLHDRFLDSDDIDKRAEPKTLRQWDVIAEVWIAN